MAIDDRERWDAKYTTKPVPQAVTPDEWLVSQAARLPPGRALDVACGLGHNAIWLAQHGWEVDAVDISPVGLNLAQTLAQQCGARVRWRAADLDEITLEREAYDLIVVFRFLDRRRLPGQITRALRPGGRLLYETFTTAQLHRPDNHLRDPAFVLQPGELPALFPGLRVDTYDECNLPDRSVARLSAVRDFESSSLLSIVEI